MKSVTAIGSCCYYTILVLATCSSTQDNTPFAGVAAFVLPQQRRYQSLSSSWISPASSSLLVRRVSLSGSDIAEQTLGDDNEGEKGHQPQRQEHSVTKKNMELDLLANKCGDFDKPVIDLATQCQNKWEELSDENSDVVSFNIVLKAWCKCCGVLAENKRQKLDHNYYSSVTDNNSNQKIVITATDAAERATTLLLQREKLQQELLENGDDAAADDLLDTTSYNTVLDAWAKSHCDQAPITGERILSRLLDNEIVRPDIISYRSVMDAWSHYASSTSSPSGRPYQNKQQQLEASKNHVSGSNNNPNTGIAETCSSTSFQKVNQIYKHVKKLSKEDPTNEKMKVNIRTVNSVIHAHAKRANALAGEKDFNGAVEVANKAYELLEGMENKYNATKDLDFRPNIMTYTSCMDAFAQCCNFRATQRAESIFRRLKFESQQNRRTDLAPNTRTYTTLIMGWSKTRADIAPTRAEELLKEMEEAFFERGSELVLPNSRTYTNVIQTWTKSRDPKKFLHALDLLKRMREHEKSGYPEMKPTLITYNTAIDACARFVGGAGIENNKESGESTRSNKNDLSLQTQALKIAFAIFKSIEQDKSLPSGPNNVTYSTLMKACAFLLPAGDERNTVATAVFEKAKKAGKVDYQVLKHLRACLDAKKLQVVLSELKDDKGNINFNQIPISWSKHAS